MVFALVASLAGFIKVRYLVDKAIIDNAVARLHYKFTAAVLFLGCLLCTANSLIGNPIECLVSGEKDDDKVRVINTFCWIMSTFTVAGGTGQSGKHHVQSGVRHFVEEEDAVNYHKYYQWVPFVLFFQGLLFYAPHWFWKNWENGKISKLSEGLRGTVTDSQEQRKSVLIHLVNYIYESMELHTWYSVGYVLSEVFYFANVIGNIYLTDVFLGGKFLTYGLDTLQLPGSHDNDPHNIDDHPDDPFPRMTKCTFKKYGPSGTIMTVDALCVLALNIINEKIYIFLWWWFIVLSILSGISLIYTLIVVLSPTARRFILYKRFKFRVPDGVKTIVDRTKVGDFLLLHLLGQNINTIIFTDVLNELSTKLGGYKASAPSESETLPLYPRKETYLPN